MKTLWAMLLVVVSLGLVGTVGAAAHADVWACKDKEGVVRFADRKLRGFRCVLYAKTPGAPPKVSDGGDGGSGGNANGGDATPVVRGGGAFTKPRAGGNYAPIPPSTERFSGDEPDDQGAREKLYSPYIEEAAKLYDIPEDFVRAVIRVESNFHYRAVSSAGAKGLMQLMPSVIGDMGVGNPWDPRANVLGGTRLLRTLADRFEGDIVKVLAAYHAGGGAVSDADGIPYEATESYVRTVLDRYYEYKSRQ